MKEVKVVYEDIESSFEVKCSELKVIKYKIYGRTKESGYKLLATKLDKQKAIDFAKNLNPEIYNGRLVIKHDEETNTDFPVDLER